MNFQRMNDFLDYMAAHRTPGCTAAIYVDNKPVYKYSAGVSDLKTGKKMSGDELFFIYSCSKVTTVTAALQLLERGAFLLNDPLYNYLPEFRHMSIQTEEGIVEAKNPIRIRDLFTMTAGFDYNFNRPSFGKTRELTGEKMDTATALRCLADEPLCFEPGTKWQYSMCHDALAGFVSVITGMPFREYVQKNIFDPLEMTQSRYHADQAALDKMATQYRYQTQSGTTDIVEAQRLGSDEEGVFVDVGKINGHILGDEFDSGGAGIITNVDDYVKLASALACGGIGATGERILAPETVELMKTNRLTTDALANSFNWAHLAGYGYGLGVRTHIDRAKSGSIARLGEFGWGGAAGATIIMDTELRMGVFFAQHVLNPREDWYQPRLRNIAYTCIDG